MKIVLIADDKHLVQNDNNMKKLQNSVVHEMVKVINCLAANKLSLSISKTKYIAIKHVNAKSFISNVNCNRIERALSCKCLGVIVDDKLSRKKNCKCLCCSISKYVGVMYKFKHYVIL